MTSQVAVWEEKVVIPTYGIGKPEKNPMFLEKRVYQGSSGVVYPYPVVEKIYDERSDKTYTGLFLENRYLKILILPELGGRVQMAYDKIKQRHFIYYNRVIKPALVGLTGPWISGGIEFNWPQHHRPSTFEPVDYSTEEGPDGSKTVWINEIERMFHTKGLVSFTLYPDKAYLEIKGRLYNRTPFPQTFLWWANPAVHVGEHYQSVFPPDVYAVYDHGRRDVSEFPIAKGVYYKVDYAPGTDISRYKNIPVPTSYMAVSSKYDFIGGYEHDTRGGLLHVADHHISPGKKQWTWGNGSFGQAWDRNLTDEDGPYIELMTGVFTDNQPDFSWLQPFEEKTFTQYFMPYAEIGLVKNASRDAAVNLEWEGKKAKIGLCVTAPFEKVSIRLENATGEILFCEQVAVSPENPFVRTVSLPKAVSPEDIRLSVKDERTNKELVAYRQEKRGQREIPAPAEAAESPAGTENNEQLYLTGLHLEQYRHATFSAADYYEEALRRDPGDVRCNNALGLWYLRRGKPEKAEGYFREAIRTLTRRNPNPYDGEPFYNLGLSLLYQERFDEACDAFYKSVWNDAWQHAGFLQLARIALRRKEHEAALELVEKSLVRNYHSHTARHLKALILGKMGMKGQALQWIGESLSIDPFNFGCLFEQYLSSAEDGDLIRFKTRMRDWENNYLEIAIDYALAGQYGDACALLGPFAGSRPDCSPMVFYYLGNSHSKTGRPAEAAAYWERAADAKPDFCFPNRVEDSLVLQQAIDENPRDAKAPYYLGNFWYDKRQYDDAIRCWERSVAIDPAFPTSHRNLALAYFNKRNDPARALAALEKAFSLDEGDARVLMELDQLYKKMNRPHCDRLFFLEKHLPLVESRDDLYLERVTLYNQLGRYEEAGALMAAFRFHPWEGGEGKVVGQHLVCHIALAKKAIDAGNYPKALKLLERAENYPENLGEGKLPGVAENDIHYFRGLALEGLGRREEARKFFRKATEGNSEPVQAIFYNDPQPDKIFYQGQAWLKLGEPARAEKIFRKLIRFGKAHMNDTVRIDYFAVSLPDLLVFDADLQLRNRIHCLYLQALGYRGLGEESRAKALYDEVLRLDTNHQGGR